MVLIAGKMYSPVDIAVDTTGNSVFVVEQRNHIISKWTYLPTATPPANFVFTLDAGRVTDITFAGGAGTMYSPNDPIIIGPPTLNIADPIQATAEVMTVGGSGDITAINILNPGNGYDPNNLPTATAATAGTPAVLVAVVSTPWGTNGNGTTGQPGPAINSTDDNFYSPTGTVLDTDTSPDELLVTDTLHNRIKRINITTGATIGVIATGGTAPNQFYRPKGIDVSTNSIMIADERNHRCQAYDSTTFAFDGVSAAASPIAFSRPVGIGFNSLDGDFDVCDTRQGVISAYGDTGLVLQSQFGTPGTDPTVPNELFHPSGGHGALPTAGGTPFADSSNNIIKTVKVSVISDTSIKTPGTGNGQMYRPNSVLAFTDTANYVLIANTRNHRIEVFDSSGTFQSTFGSPF